jgi:hypothetical protein
MEYKRRDITLFQWQFSSIRQNVKTHRSVSSFACWPLVNILLALITGFITFQKCRGIAAQLSTGVNASNFSLISYCKYQ